MKMSYLKKNYPKGFKKFIIKKYKIEKSHQHSRYYSIKEIETYGNVRNFWSDIVDFMDKQGIYISVSRVSCVDKSYFVINVVSTVHYKNGGYTITSRKVAETLAIKDAFKKLEDCL